MKSTLEERLAGYKATLLEKIKRTNWEDEDECSYKSRGRKPKQIKHAKPRFRSEGERRAWEQQQLQQKQQPKKQKYNWF